MTFGEFESNLQKEMRKKLAKDIHIGLTTKEEAKQLMKEFCTSKEEKLNVKEQPTLEKEIFAAIGNMFHCLRKEGWLVEGIESEVFTIKFEESFVSFSLEFQEDRTILIERGRE